MALLELHIDIREGLPASLAQRHQAVVGHDQPQGDQYEKPYDDPTRGAHGVISVFSITASLSAVSQHCRTMRSIHGSCINWVTRPQFPGAQDAWRATLE